MVITGTVQTFTAPVSGWYEVHLWGAKGGNDGGGVGAAGGYTTGTVHMNARQNIYVYIGDSGLNSSPSYGKAGYNGGGLGSTGGGSSGSGGGASDIRSVSGAWYNNLYSRILVAGGGGGAGLWSNGGVGGGLVGGTGYHRGGTQSSAGPRGGFGVGGSASCDGGGGGGGWYGGGASSGGGPAEHGYDEGGGGGSSYIGGTATNPVKNARTIAGNSAMPNTQLNGTMIGNSGPCFGYFYLVSRD